MSMSEKCTEIVPFRYSADDLTISFDLIAESSLSLKHQKGIYNAWEQGVKVDPYGRLWICQSQLHTILRTTKENARYYLLSIGEKYKLEVQGKTYVQGSEVYRLLDITIQSAGSITKEKYAKFSEKIYREIRDCDTIKTIRYEFYEATERHKKELKKIRIRQLRLTKDELTGKELDGKNSDFSHIRGAKTYLHLADKYWNGLVVNKETHSIITEASINDEDQLYDLCVDRGWDTEWYSIFSQCLDSY